MRDSTSSILPRAAVSDRPLHGGNGYLMLALRLVLLAASIWYGVGGFDPFSPCRILAGAFGALVGFVWLMGLVVLQPKQSLVRLLFGDYVGTEHAPGFVWVNPFNSKKKVSRRLETLERGPLKVNDAVGNPVDIGAVIVWRVENAAKATLEAHDYQGYVKAQSETALRRLASAHPYDQE